MKLSPFYSSLPHFVAGSRTRVRGQRFSSTASTRPTSIRCGSRPRGTLHLSTPDELLLRLRWLAIVSPQTTLELAASGGVHAPIDAVKAIMAGAHVVQVVSTLLRHGPAQLRLLVDGLRSFLDEQDYPSLDAMRGNMNHARSPDPGAYERSDYIQLLSELARPLRRYSSLLFSLDSFSLMNARISSAMSSSLVHCSL